MNSPSRSSAFTLIELLVVISIIGILASLAIPAVGGALDSARRTQAKNDVVQIATAVAAYETEYGKLPPVSRTVNQNLINILMPSESSDDNPRRIVFLEVPSIKVKGTENRGQKSGQLNGTGDFLDPWGDAYKIAVDDNYDHTIPTSDLGGPRVPTTPLRKKVAVWNEPSVQPNRRAVASWD